MEGTCSNVSFLDALIWASAPKSRSLTASFSHTFPGHKVVGHFAAWEFASIYVSLIFPPKMGRCARSMPLGPAAYFWATALFTALQALSPVNATTWRCLSEIVHQEVVDAAGSYNGYNLQVSGGSLMLNDGFPIINDCIRWVGNTLQLPADGSSRRKTTSSSKSCCWRG